MNVPSWLEIDLCRLESNLRWWRGLLDGESVGDEGGVAKPQALPGAGAALGNALVESAGTKRVKICGVVKADAYGLGAVPIAQRLSAAGIDMLAVYCILQADALLDAGGIDCPVLILNAMHDMQVGEATALAVRRGQVHLAIDSPVQVDEIHAMATRLEATIPVHLHLDTGMSRSGLNVGQFAQTLKRVADRPRLRLAGVYSHFASAGENVAFAYEQLQRFEQVLAEHRASIGPDVIRHTSNTAGAARDRRFHLDMVRIGLGLYGHGPSTLTSGPMLEPVRKIALAGGAGGGVVGPGLIVRWLSRLVHVQRYPRGTTVGYCQTHRLSRDSVLGVVPVGHADGYPVALSNKAMVRLMDEQGRRPAAAASVVGSVSMDQTIVDLTDVPADLAKVGTVVELHSPDPKAPNYLPRLAEVAGTNVYEMLCRLSRRLPRRYIESRRDGGATIRGARVSRGGVRSRGVDKPGAVAA